MSNSGTDVAAHKRVAHRKRQNLKQKSTQTEAYDDLFLSDDSITSADETALNDPGAEPNANKLSIDDTYCGSIDSTSLLMNNHVMANTNHRSESLDYSPTNSNQMKIKPNRRRHKISKRRKSLPSQGSSNEDSHPVTMLIPRGPLICYNSENFGSWLPDYSLKTSQNRTQSIANTPVTISKNKTHLMEDDEECMSLPTVNRGHSSPIPFSSAKSGECAAGSEPAAALCSIYSPSVSNYDVNIVKTSVYSTSNASEKHGKDVKAKKKGGGSRKSSDFMLNEYIDDYRLDDELNDSSLSSNEDDDDEDEYYEDDEVRRNANAIMRKLKEAEKVGFWAFFSMRFFKVFYL